VSEPDLREELSAIARAARRLVERERAAGGGELLAQSAAKSAGAAGSPAAERAARPALPAPAADRAPRPGPPAPAAVNLFGEPEPEPAAAPGAATATLEFELPSHHEPLNPAGWEARGALAAASLPVLEQVAGEARACRKCGLCETRTNAVPGIGSARSGIVFVGEAPGADEDRRGEPFVGRAGELLTRIIEAMDKAALIPGVPLSRETVYICNVLKCRPPENRNPLPHEIEMCSPYLHRQLETLQPRIICCLGKFAAELLLGLKGTVGGMRGRTYRHHGAKLIVTYHPAACLRNPGYKRPVWEDMQRLALEYQSD
jgi:uracil-DNA glycosylase family 4